jgi:polyisoprenoid-binding protein YceI
MRKDERRARAGRSRLSKEIPMLKRLAACLAAAALPLSAGAAPESYTLDPYHSFPYFEADHFGFTSIRGRFDKTTGKFTIDTAARTGTVELTIQTGTITTGDNERGDRARSRDEHLRTPDFFNVAEFPVMTFQGRTAKWNGEAPSVIDGQLTLLGVTKPLTLTVDRWKCGPDPRTQGKRYMCGGSFTGSLRRSDFGMKFLIPGVADEVKLWIGIEAFRN